jgi:hypothetical protein
MSVPPAEKHPTSLEMLCPSEMIVPLQLPPAAPSTTIEFFLLGLTLRGVTLLLPTPALLPSSLTDPGPPPRLSFVTVRLFALARSVPIIKIKPLKTATPSPERKSNSLKASS